MGNFLFNCFRYKRALKTKTGLAVKFQPTEQEENKNWSSHIWQSKNSLDTPQVPNISIILWGLSLENRVCSEPCSHRKKSLRQIWTKEWIQVLVWNLFKKISTNFLHKSERRSHRKHVIFLQVKFYILVIRNLILISELIKRNEVTYLPELFFVLPCLSLSMIFFQFLAFRPFQQYRTY